MKYNCNVIRDLMPLCQDNAASEESKKSVIAHISECTKCQEYYRIMTHESALDYEKDQETHNYALIAKKLRRKKIIVRIIAVLLITTFMMFCLSYAAGYRLTPKSASETDSKLNFASRLTGSYDWGSYQFYIYDCGGYFTTSTVQKTWLGWKNLSNIFVYEKMSASLPLEIVGALYQWGDNRGIQIFPIICHDNEVAQIEVSFFGKTQKKDISFDKLTIFAFENTDKSLTNTASGKAYDKYGTVLYELRENENMEWEWVK